MQFSVKDSCFDRFRIIARDNYYNHTNKRFIELGIMKFENINKGLLIVG